MHLNSILRIGFNFQEEGIIDDSNWRINLNITRMLNIFSKKKMWGSFKSLLSIFCLGISFPLPWKETNWQQSIDQMSWKTTSFFFFIFCFLALIQIILFDASTSLAWEFCKFQRSAWWIYIYLYLLFAVYLQTKASDKYQL